MDEAIDKIMGSGLTPEEIITSNETADGPSGLRYRVDTAFRTAYDILYQMEQMTNRRKAFIYLSSGYDLDPFKDSRLQYQMELYNHLTVPSDPNADPSTVHPVDATMTPRGAAAPQNPFAQEASLFSEADLMREIGELIRTAKRADTVFYTVDPRGLIAASAPGGSQLTAAEWSDYATTSVSTLKVLAEQTGGIAGVNTNDFVSFFRKVDADFSDYYEIGYYSSNIDPTKRTRKIEVKVTRPGMKVVLNRDSYQLQSSGEAKKKPDKIIKK
jgi:VWFA-related protein